MNISKEKLALIWEYANNSDNPTVQSALESLITAVCITHGVEIEKRLEDLEGWKPNLSSKEILALIKSKTP